MFFLKEKSINYTPLYLNSIQGREHFHVSALRIDLLLCILLMTSKLKMCLLRHIYKLTLTWKCLVVFSEEKNVNFVGALSWSRENQRS